MLQKYYGYHGSGDTLTGEVYRQARYLGCRGKSPGEVSRQVRVWAGVPRCIYARGELEAASWELDIRAGELRAAS